MKFYIVDAFTDTLFGGNPAGVVLLDGADDFPEDEKMRLTAAELRYSETAYVKPLESGSFHTRYFTPTDEVDLCGHATLASGWVVADLVCHRRVDPGPETGINEQVAGSGRDPPHRPCALPA